MQTNATKCSLLKVVVHIKNAPRKLVIVKMSDTISEEKEKHAYLVWDQNIVSLWDRLGDIGNQGILKITQTTRLPISLDPCEMWELHNKQYCQHYMKKEPHNWPQKKKIHSCLSERDTEKPICLRRAWEYILIGLLKISFYQHSWRKVCWMILGTVVWCIWHKTRRSSTIVEFTRE